MKLQEKSAFAQRNLVYDTIPLIIIDKMERKHFQDNKETPKYYYISPFWMKFRLLLFWTLWFMLIVALTLCILMYFCFTPRMCYNSNVHKNINGR